MLSILLSDQNLFFVLAGIFLSGLGVLAWRVLTLEKKLKLVFGESHGDEKLSPAQAVIQRIMKLETWKGDVTPRMELLEKISKIAIQKVGFIRFNPFDDTGGDNSFIAVLLDRDNTGFLVSSLYTREGVRLYGKPIQVGKSKYPLSDEEKKILEEVVQKEIHRNS